MAGDSLPIKTSYEKQKGRIMIRPSALLSNFPGAPLQKR
jgi:hypothetical protein